LAIPAPANTPSQAGAVRVAYKWKPGAPLSYRLSADIKGKVPILENPVPQDVEAVLKLVFVATPKSLTSDGAADIRIEAVSPEAELFKIPIEIADDQVKKVLNCTVTVGRQGDVRKVGATGETPFALSIPGVDPKRLHNLIYPITFPEAAIRPGEFFEYRGELLGGETAKPVFRAKLLPGASGGTMQFVQEFKLPVDQRLDEKKKPITGDGEVFRTRRGEITGSGTYRFDPAKGLFTSGQLEMRADIAEEAVKPPKDPEEPKSIVSKIVAKINIRLMDPASPKSGAKSGNPKPKDP
jgi:hypothetical protein